MSVLFLDVDGVLNRSPSHEDNQLWTQPAPGQKAPWITDLNTVFMLNAVIRQTEIKIVVSSTWRLHPTRDALDFSDKSGVDAALLHPDWRTIQSVKNGVPRWFEINEWLSRHPEEGGAFMVVDDGSDAGAGFPDRFLLTDARVGLTYGGLTVILRKLGYTLQGSHKVQRRSGWTAPGRAT